LIESGQSTYHIKYSGIMPDPVILSDTDHLVLLGDKSV